MKQAFTPLRWALMREEALKRAMSEARGRFAVSSGRPARKEVSTVRPNVVPAGKSPAGMVKTITVAFRTIVWLATATALTAGKLDGLAVGVTPVVTLTVTDWLA